MGFSNRSILTSGSQIYARKKALKNKHVDEVVYDPKAREEYLTGFHKRKVHRQENARKKAQEREAEQKRAERLELRKERRLRLQERIESYNKALQEQMENDDVEKGNEDVEEENDKENNEESEKDEKPEKSDDEWNGFDDSDEENPKSILKRKEKKIYKNFNGEIEATVSIEEISFEQDDVYKPNPKEVLAESLAKAKEAADIAKAFSNIPKERKPKFRYLSKGERKVQRLKQKASRFRKGKK